MSAPSNLRQVQLTRLLVIGFGWTAAVAVARAAQVPLGADALLLDVPPLVMFAAAWVTAALGRLQLAAAIVGGLGVALIFGVSVLTGGLAAPFVPMLLVQLVFIHRFLGRFAARRALAATVLGVVVLAFVQLAGSLPEPVHTFSDLEQAVTLLVNLGAAGLLLGWEWDDRALQLEQLRLATVQLESTNAAVVAARQQAVEHASHQQALAKLTLEALSPWLGGLGGRGAAVELVAARACDTLVVALGGAKVEVVGPDGAVMVARGCASERAVVAVRKLEPQGKAWGSLRVWLETGGRRRPDDAENALIDGVAALLTTMVAREAMAQVLRQTEAQLSEAQRLEPVWRLTSGVMHDLRNALSAIDLNADGVQADVAAGLDPADAVADLRDGVSVAQQMAAEVVALSRGDRGGHRDGSACLTAVVQSTAALVRRALPSGIELVLKTDLETACVPVPAGALSQVVLNLVVNARDAMAAGGTLTVQVKPGPKDTACLLVTDTGCGIPEAQQARIFDPFFTTRGRSGGTGLGLSVLSSIVEAADGSVTVASTEGEGTTFRVLLPRLDAPGTSGLSCVKTLGSGRGAGSAG